MGTINSDEHDAEHGVRSGPEQPLAQEHRDKPGASSYQQDNSGKQRGDVKRAGASARTIEHDRALSGQPYRGGQCFFCVHLSYRIFPIRHQ